MLPNLLTLCAVCEGKQKFFASAQLPARPTSRYIMSIVRSACRKKCRIVPLKFVRSTVNYLRCQGKRKTHAREKSYLNCICYLKTHGTAAHQPQTLFKHIRNYSSNSFLSAEHNQIIKYLSSCFFRVRLTFFSLPRNSFASRDHPACKSTMPLEFCNKLKVLLQISTLRGD